MATPAPRARTTLTGRALVLALVALVLLVALALPVRAYLSQRAELAGLADRKATAEAEIAALREQQNRWADPAYVKAQARDRLHFVMPGETGYVVLRPSTEPPPRQVAPEGAPTAPTTPWYETLWESAQGAGSR
jgi:cell division protein FtsB